MHKDVSKRQTRRRDEGILVHCEKTHVIPVNFHVGDYFLIAQRLANTGHKLRVKWNGPYRVIAAESDLVFKVEDLVTQTQDTVYAIRLKRYADDPLQVTEKLLDTIAHNKIYYNTVEKILNLRYNEDKNMYQV